MLKIACCNGGSQAYYDSVNDRSYQLFDKSQITCKAGSWDSLQEVSGCQVPPKPKAFLCLWGTQGMLCLPEDRAVMNGTV